MQKQKKKGGVVGGAVLAPGLAPGALRSLDSKKIELFTKGASKKSPMDRAREQLLRKQKLHEDEKARVLEEFQSSFGGDGGGGRFVKAGTLLPGEKHMSDGRDEEEEWRPSFPMKRKAEDNGGSSSSGGGGSGKGTGGKKRKMQHMEDLIEELKKEHDDNGGRKSSSLLPTPAATAHHSPAGGAGVGVGLGAGLGLGLGAGVGVGGGVSAPVDDGDPNTTNLYVGNLSPQVSEEHLLATFGQYGEVASVKIMWPRTEEEMRRGRNCGFVAFMDRADAARALTDLNGFAFEGFSMRVGWGKAVPKPPFPLNPGGGVPAHLAPLAPVVGPNAMAAAVPTPVPLGAPPLPSAPIVGSGEIEIGVVVPAGSAQIKIRMPASRERRSFIDRMARYVAREGYEFEQVVLQQEHDNPRFLFLSHHALPLEGQPPPPPPDASGDGGEGSAFDEHWYYKWRVWSLANGDSLSKWRQSPFQITPNGPYIIPPRADSQSRDKVSRGAPPTGLTDAQVQTFSEMLRALTVERPRIAEAMVFALENAEWADEVIGLITDSLCIRTTPVASKVARLYLVSDILNNSSASVKNASAYRTGLQSRLGVIFEKLRECLVDAQSHIIRKAYQERVLSVLRAWQQWSLYPGEFVDDLRRTFQEGREAVEAAKAESVGALAGSDRSNADDDGDDDDDLDGEALDDDDIDGEPLDDNAPVFGGLPDPAPLASSPPSPPSQPAAQPSAPPPPKNKWERADEALFGSDGEDGEPLDDPTPAPSPVTAQDLSRESAAHDLLRKVEIRVAEFADELEARGVDKARIEAQCADLRARLLRDAQ